MSALTSIFISISIILALAKTLKAKNSYEKILGFYFIFTNIIILILVNSVTGFEDILDIALILLLLQMAAVLFLLFKQKKLG